MDIDFDSYSPASPPEELWRLIQVLRHDLKALRADAAAAGLVTDTQRVNLETEEPASPTVAVPGSIPPPH